MITVNIDEKEAIKLVHEKIAKLVKEAETEYVFWDSVELRKRTCMSWNAILDTFFHDPRFKKTKIGKKWYFPAKETRLFLETWLFEQSY
ncbi:group-specific protein [Paenibacillus polymyxa]|uniref:group-specific protein n=1 Tax=Paenibacillus polymyxa TaxID=1406 RepID=UPI002ED63F5F|nr:group-specific protein [Paenibacillus polymyxa]